MTYTLKSVCESKRQDRKRVEILSLVSRKEFSYHSHIHIHARAHTHLYIYIRTYNQLYIRLLNTVLIRFIVRYMYLYHKSITNLVKIVLHTSKPCHTLDIFTIDDNNDQGVQINLTSIRSPSTVDD